MVKEWGVVKMNYKTLLGFCLIVFGFLFCQKQKENTDNYNYKSIGTITGQDIRMCPSPCCSGWFDYNTENCKRIKKEICLLHNKC